MFTYFTIKSSNDILPDVIKKYTFVMACKEEMMRTEEELEMSSREYSFKRYIEVKQHLNTKLVKFYNAIKELEDTGVVIKSIDDGLLDFPAKRFDEEIWLCWKMGETEIKFWHEIDSGFNGRKPIQVNAESLV